MTRRDFIAAVGVAGLVASKATASPPFPVHYAKPNPYDAVLRYLDPGSDQFKGEKDAVDLEARLGQIFAAREPPPAALQPWMQRRAEILASRFYALPGKQVRYEIKTATAYY